MPTFSATLYQVGVNRCVDVPPWVSDALGGGLRITVRGRIESVPFRSTLVPRGGGCHRLFVHSRVWRPRALASGTILRVEMDRDSAPVEPEVPRDFLEALAQRPIAQRVFAAVTPATRREIVRWLASARRTETRERRIELGLDRLEEMNRKKRKWRNVHR
ncbi:MAG: DUF1905 domain-containing protein [Gemmatimonadetes bacterium]|nr:DUF1905 domain-containing protein [Gemmatimonadota bacterium]